MKKAAGSTCCIILLFIQLDQRAFAVGIPLFTADYYLANPKGWLGKNVTLAVASLNVRNEADREDGLRQMSAYTYNQGDSGGYIEILATPAAASRLLSLIGTNLQFTAAGVRVIMIQGIFRQETEGRKHYFIYVNN